MSVVGTLTRARGYITRGYHPGQPVYPTPDGLKICDYEHPQACAWDLDSALVLGSEGNLLHEDQARNLLNTMVPRWDDEDEGNALRWSNALEPEPGHQYPDDAWDAAIAKRQAELVALLTKAIVKATRIEAARSAA